MPEEYKTKLIKARVTGETIRKLDKLAALNGENRSQYLRRMIDTEWDMMEAAGVLDITTLPHPEGATSVPLVTVKGE